jgi:peptide/nickel transport system permease protein
MVDTVITGNWVAFHDALVHLILLAITLALPQVAMISRMTRASMLEVLGQDYIRTSRAKGLSERVVNYRHGLRNALIPVTTVVGLSLAWLLTGSVVTEVVFYWPGLGRYGVEAILAFDFPGVMAFTIIAACVFVFANLATDVLYMRLDPRLRGGGRDRRRGAMLGGAAAEVPRARPGASCGEPGGASDGTRSPGSAC